MKKLRRRFKAYLNQGFCEKEKSIQWLIISAKKFSKFYKSYIKIALNEAQKNPGKFKLIKYEDFVNNPEIELIQLFQFLEEPYENCIPEQKIDTSNDKGDPVLFQNIKKKTKNYQDYITDMEKDYIQSKLSPLMENLHFPYYS